MTTPAPPQVRATLVGVGVGPGDPELVTVKAIRVLESADVVFVPVSDGNGLYGPPPDGQEHPGSSTPLGRAEATVRAHVSHGRIRRLPFRMTGDADYTTPAATVAAVLTATPGTATADATPGTATAHADSTSGGGGVAASGLGDGSDSGRASGRVVAFATIGDPNVYSTFTQLAAHVRAVVPGVVIETVPGIMALQDLAARSGTVLAHGTETLALLPLTAGVEAYRQAVADHDTVVAYKGGRALPQVLAVLGEAGRLDGSRGAAVYGAALGLPGSDVRPAGELPAEPGPYLSTVIATRRPLWPTEFKIMTSTRHAPTPGTVETPHGPPPATADAGPVPGHVSGQVSGHVSGPVAGHVSGPVAEFGLSQQPQTRYVTQNATPADGHHVGRPDIESASRAPRERRRRRGRVTFVGAGPGAADLVTLRGARTIASADVVVWASSLVHPDVVAHARPGALVVDSAGIPLEAVTALYRRAAVDGLHVARVHSGDPALWGAVQEQLEICAGLALVTEVVPGVSSVTAAAAAIQRELTVPEVAQTVILTRLGGGKTPMPPGEQVRELARHGTTMALFLSTARSAALQRELLDGGYPADTPCVVAYRVSWPEELVVGCTLGELAGTVKAHRLWKHTLVLVGPALAAGGTRSHLYHPGHFHGFRRAEPQARAELRTHDASLAHPGRPEPPTPA